MTKGVMRMEISDLLDICKRVNELTSKHPNLNKEEIEELGGLCSNLSIECEHVLLDWDE
jgi:hypothetical protein